MSNPLTRVVDALAPARLGRGFRWLLGVVARHQRRRRRRAGRRPAARRVADARPVPRLAGAPVRSTCRCCSSVPGRRRRRTGSTGERMVVGREPRARDRAGRARDHDRHRHREHRASSWSRCSRWGRPRRSPTSAAARLLPSLVAREDLGIANARMQGAFLLVNQLARPADRCVPVRDRHGAAVRRQRGLLRARRPAGQPRSSSTSPSRVRERRTRALRAGHGRGRPLARGPPADADAGAHDLRVQRHVRRGVVGARAVRDRAAGDGRGRVRAADDRDGDRRHRRHGRVRAAGAPVLARRHHARRPA